MLVTPPFLIPSIPLRIPLYDIIRLQKKNIFQKEKSEDSNVNKLIIAVIHMQKTAHFKVIQKTLCHYMKGKTHIN